MDVVTLFRFPSSLAISLCKLEILNFSLTCFERYPHEYADLQGNCIAFYYVQVLGGIYHMLLGS